MRIFPSNQDGRINGDATYPVETVGQGSWFLNECNYDFAAILWIFDATHLKWYQHRGVWMLLIRSPGRLVMVDWNIKAEKILLNPAQIRFKTIR